MGAGVGQGSQRLFLKHRPGRAACRAHVIGETIINVYKYMQMPKCNVTYVNHIKKYNDTKKVAKQDYV